MDEIHAWDEPDLAHHVPYSSIDHHFQTGDPATDQEIKTMRKRYIRFHLSSYLVKLN